MAESSRGRSRDAIRAAAAALFTRHGYAGTSVRDIAAAASVDPALVIRHFGSKEALFLETMQVELGARPFDGGPLDSLGERFIRHLLAADDDVKGVFLALLRASDAGDVNLRLREVHERNFVAPLRDRLTGPDAELRSRLAASVVGGLLYSLWVVGDVGLAAADRETLIRTHGALLQALLTPAEGSDTPGR